MAKIYIVRHGQDTDNEKKILNGYRDNSLTSTGRQQVKKIVKQLAEKDIKAIHISPLKRCKETAQIIADKLNIEKVNIEDQLIERDYGVFTGKPIADIPKFARKTMKAADGVTYFLDGKDVENFPTLYKRCQKLIEKLKDLHKNENILLVTHNDIGKTLRAVYNGWTWEEGLNTDYFDNSTYIILE